MYITVALKWMLKAVQAHEARPVVDDTGNGNGNGNGDGEKSRERSPEARKSILGRFKDALSPMKTRLQGKK